VQVAGVELGEPVDAQKRERGADLGFQEFQHAADARLSGGRILITTSRFPEDSFWKVRVRVWGGDIRDWTEVGVLRTQDDSAARYFYDLPNNLADDDLYICLKNMVTNEAKCVVSTR